MVVHPAGIPDSMRYAIDRFVLKGGKAIVYIDRTRISRASGSPMLDQGAPESASSLPQLLGRGVDFTADKVVVMPRQRRSAGCRPPPVAHLGFLGLGSNRSPAGRGLAAGRSTWA
jgi:hypothetical protein